MSKHLFPYKWYLKDGYPAKGIDYHGSKVFGTFICGGGSSMGYKLSGYDHLGGVEIDPKVAEVYRANHNPKHLYIEDIREFNKRTDLPKELYELDLLDGSPPCSSFSMAGNREKDWGKKKVFREGQADQVLDDLVFEYVRTINKLQPKVALLENVKGLIQGNAKSYAKRLKKQFTEAGYRVQVFLLNAASMGVPQKRERVFFIGLRDDIELPNLKLYFNEMPILYGEFANKNGTPLKQNSLYLKRWKKRIPSDKNMADISKRAEGINSGFNDRFLKKNEIAPTLTSKSDCVLKYDVPNRTTVDEDCSIGSFPQDYNFNPVKSGYLIGMSVPPVMTAQIANQIYKQWLNYVKTT